jgi:hypothetical protein
MTGAFAFAFSCFFHVVRLMLIVIELEVLPAEHKSSKKRSKLQPITLSYFVLIQLQHLSSIKKLFPGFEKQNFLL